MYSEREAKVRKKSFIWTIIKHSPILKESLIFNVTPGHEIDTWISKACQPCCRFKFSHLCSLPLPSLSYLHILIYNIDPQHQINQSKTYRGRWFPMHMTLLEALNPYYLIVKKNSFTKYLWMANTTDVYFCMYLVDIKSYK